jgi:ADP-heptose:LPS heptosyltransferase
MALVRVPEVEIVNLAAIKAERLYDLLGLYDHAVGLVTSDTATLHLAAASKVPYIALLNNGGAGSIPKGNCILSIRYSNFRNELGRFMEAVKTFQ